MDIMGEEILNSWTQSQQSYTWILSLLSSFMLILVLRASMEKMFSQYSERDKTEKGRLNSGYSEIPGYTIVGELKNLYKIATNPTRIMDHMYESVAAKGDICKIPLIFEDFVFLAKPEYAQALFSSSDTGHLEKSAIIYRVAFEFTVGNDLITAPVQFWQLHRKEFGKVFTYNYFKHYVSSSFNLRSKQLVADLERLYFKEGEDFSRTCQLSHEIHICALKIILDTITGNKSLRTEDYETIQKVLKTGKKLVRKRLMTPWLVFDTSWRLAGYKSEYKKTVTDVFDCEVKKLLKLENNNLELGDNILSILKNSTMSEQDKVANMKGMITGGYATSAAAIHYLLFMLALHKEDQEKCREEVDAIFDKPDYIVDKNIDFFALSELKHLEKCLLETLRLHPIIPIFGRKLKAPLKLDEGIEIPPGTNVAVFPPNLHKNPKIFQNPEAFDPERFSTENCKSRKPYSFIPFSAGPRNCIGYKYAIFEAKIMVAHILRKFEISTTDVMHHIPLFPCVVLTPERDYNFVLKKRQH